MELGNKIDIICNASYKPEREYVYNYVIEERLGLSVSISYRAETKEYTSVCFPNGKELRIAEKFFATSDKDWLKQESLPKSPLHRISTENTILDGVIMHHETIEIYGLRKEAIMEKDFVNIDLFGSIFYLLSGYEEYVKLDLNEFGNFPYESSLSCKEDFNKRPIVDEYIEILWTIFKNECSSLQRKICVFKFTPTHDIDRTFMYYGNSLSRHLKSSIGDIIKRRDFNQLLLRNKSFLFKGMNDPFNTFDWLMNYSDKFNLKSIFYFKNSMADSPKDSPYRIDKIPLNRIFNEIDKRGHYIGIHPSYETQRDENLMKFELEGLRNHLLKIGVKQEISRVRQHYLRYTCPLTNVLQSRLGLKVDSTLGYQSNNGFRRGTCHEFYIFNLSESKIMEIKESPLIMMDVTLDREWKNSFDKYASVKSLVDTCKFYKGNFVLLWHNELLVSEEQRELYSQIIQLVS